MTITRFSPIRNGRQEAAFLQNRLQAIFQELAHSPAPVSTESLAGGSFTPAVDIYEDAQQLTVKLEVPGIRQEDLDIRVEGRTLTVKGQRRFEAQEKAENFHRVERRFGSFMRSFTLPQTVDVDTVKASYENGVLHLSIAKKAEAQPKQIKIDVSSTPREQVEAPETEAKA